MAFFQRCDINTNQSLGLQYGGHGASELTWSPSEKKAARKAFDLALHRELDAVMKEAKSLAAKASTPGDLWHLEDYLARSRKAIDEKYDYRYSRLIVVLAVLAEKESDRNIIHSA